MTKTKSVLGAADQEKECGMAQAVANATVQALSQ
jgi:hypothetical protein